ncbi:MAG: alanine racemase [Patescibacteria group bacterium]|jgi:alanine racemase
MSLPLSYIELSKNNLIHNVKIFRSLLKPKVKLSVVVKGNAYGHGQNEIVKLLAGQAAYFQVDDLDELIRLRKATKQPVLMLGYVTKQQCLEVVKHNAELAIFDATLLAALQEAGQRLNKMVRVHISIDALLGREGTLIEKLPALLTTIKKHSQLKVVGVYSHFANIEDTTNLSHARKQLHFYQRAVQLLEQHGYKNVLQHVSATSGILTCEQQHAHALVRLGVGVYGLWPSLALQKQYEHKQYTLKPVLRWVTHVAQVKLLPKGYPIGYGLTYITKKSTKIALIPQGYSDGYDRGLSNCGEVLIRGQVCKVLGRISMNMFTVDVTNVRNIKVEDEVVLLGKQGKAEITAEAMAKKLHTINYEIISRISPLLPRIVRK